MYNRPDSSAAIRPGHTPPLCAGLHKLNQAHIALPVVRADPGALHLFLHAFPCH